MEEKQSDLKITLKQACDFFDNLKKEELFQQELTALINKYNQESDSSTPDYILSEYLLNCLKAYNLAVQDRDKHLGLKVLGMKELVK